MYFYDIRTVAGLVSISMLSTTKQNESKHVTHSFLFTFDGELESRQLHVVIADCVRLPSNGNLHWVGDGSNRFRVVVEDDLQFAGAARLVQQLDGKVLTLFRKLLVLTLYIIIIIIVIIVHIFNVA